MTDHCHTGQILIPESTEAKQGAESPVKAEMKVPGRAQWPRRERQGGLQEARLVVDEGMEAARATSCSASLLFASGLGPSTENLCCPFPAPLTAGTTLDML